MKNPRLFQTILEDCLNHSADPVFLEQALRQASPSTWMWIFGEWGIPVVLRTVQVKRRHGHFPWGALGRETVSSALAIESAGWFWREWDRTWIPGEKDWLSGLRQWLNTPAAAALSPFHGFTVWQEKTGFFGVRLTSDGPRNVAVSDFSSTALRHWSVGEEVRGVDHTPGRYLPPMLVDWVRSTAATMAARQIQAGLDTRLPPADLPASLFPSRIRRL